MIVYYHTEFGVAVDEFSSLVSARRSIQREIGTIHTVYEVREATTEDVAWIQAMGGYIPNSAKEMLKGKK